MHIWQREHAAEIAERLGAGADIGSRQRLVASMYANESEEVKAKIVQMVEEEYAAAREEYEKQLDVGSGVIPELDEEGRSE